MSSKPAAIRPITPVLTADELRRLAFLRWLIAKGYVTEGD